MNKDRQIAFDNFAAKRDAYECDLKIKQITAELQNNVHMSPSDRELWLEDLNGWIRHYRERVCS